MKCVRLTPLLLMIGSLAGCGTSGSYCDIARAVHPSRHDRLTEETQRQILAENEKLERICGVRP